MKKSLKEFLVIFHLVFAAILSGCGGGGGSTAAAPATPAASGTIASLTSSVSGSYKEATTIDFTATFSEAVTVTGSPRIVLNVGGTAKYATYLSGSGTTILVFRYTVDGGATDTNGILVGGIQMNSGTILNAAGGLVDLGFLPPDSSGILVDTTAPSTQSATGPANATYVPGNNLNFTLTFNELVNVTGTPRLTLTVGSTTRYADYLSGTGTAVLNFRYTVQANESDLNGIDVAASLDLNGGLITDVATNAASLSFTAPNTASVNVTFTCPTGYVAVLPLSPYTTSQFCVAKYEIKNVSSVATSQPTGTLWVSINRANSITACTSLGAGYNLISNAQWQAIARNLEGVGFNWATGTVGNAGGMSTGHTDGSAGGLAAVADDNDSCAGTGQTCDLTTWSDQRRVHRFASGLYIWDFSGNLSEWIRDDISTSFGSNSFSSLITTTTHTTNGTIGGVSNSAKYHFGPAGDYTALSSAPYGGLGYQYMSIQSDAIFRGSEMTSGATAGMFMTNLSAGSAATSGSIGFRCVWAP